MMTIASDTEFESLGSFAKALISEKNMMQLGLGRLAKKMQSLDDQKGEIINKLKEELIESVQHSLDEENIDPTLFYFTLESD